LRAGEESCRLSFTEAKPEEGLPSFGDLDRLDRLALVLLVFLLVSALGLIIFQPGQTGATVKKGGGVRQMVVIINPELDKKLAAATSLLNGGDPLKAGQLLDALISEFPYEGGPHMLKGDLFLRKQQPVEALLEYRQGVDLNPDYLDKKMVEVFQGKKVKSTLEEARRAIDVGLAGVPGDATLLEQRKVLYYMLRKVAGSCG
jgi:tetratricopeptide (TPR) repeat protein